MFISSSKFCSALYYSGVLQRNKTNRIYTYREREIDLKDLAHTVVRAGKSKTYRAGQQAGNSRRFLCCSLEEELLLL